MDQTKASQFLFAKLFRTLRTIEGFKPDFESTRILPPIQRDSGRVVMFSAAFILPSGRLILPFSMTFSRGSNGVPVSGMFQMAIAAKTGHKERVFAFLSVNDYLAAIGELPVHSVKEHIKRITKSGELAERVAYCDKYPTFCERAAKDLPYDLSLEILEEIAAAA